MESREAAKEDAFDKKLEENVGDYIKDLKEKTEFPDTLPDKFFEASDLKKLSPQETKKMRNEFNKMKEGLIQQWEEKNGCEWPRNETDVYITNGSGNPVKVQQEGARYDVHHIQPIGLGGKNEVDNITPLKADVHSRHQGVHRAGGPYDRMDKMLGDN
ncbi:HNH endonuclease [bacterium D16-51]|nr:HNH endonuclease [bacterium D16-59]RKI58460.1 HNH endonuclease [bacterium D16-51]